MRRGARIILRAAGVLVILALLTTIAALLVVRSPWFREQVRSRAVAELERVTGGRAAIGSVQLDWNGLKATVTEIVVRGSEPETSPPLLRIPKVEAGLRILSLMKREVDLASLTVEGPAVNLIVAADGSTNVPRPKTAGRGKDAVETIFDLAVKRFRLERGLLTVDDRKTPFSVRGDDLRVELGYERAKPRYVGKVSLTARQARFRDWNPADLRIATDVEVEKNRAAFPHLRVETAKSRIEAGVTVDGFTAPAARARFQAHADVGEWARILKIPEIRGGSAQASGEAYFRDAGDYAVTAAASVTGASVRSGRAAVEGAGASLALRVVPGRVRLEQIDARALGGRFQGSAEVSGPRYELTGELSALKTAAALAAAGLDAAAWSGEVSGPVKLRGLTGSRHAALEARLAIAPAPGGIPLSGLVDVRADTAAQSVEFTASSLQTPASAVTFTGKLGSQVRVNFQSADLDELLPAIRMLAANPPETMPVKLDHGSVRFEGLVTGRLDAPRVSGRVEAANLVYEGRKVDSIRLEQVTASGEELRVEGGSLVQAPLSLRFEGRAALDGWKLTRESEVEGTLSTRDAPLADLLVLAGRKDLAASGVLSLSARVSGSLGDPRAEAVVAVAKASFRGEKIDRLEAKAFFSAQTIEVRDAQAQAAGGRIRASGRFDHPPDDLRNGSVQFEISAAGVRLESMETAGNSVRGLRGVVKADLKGEGILREGTPEVRSLNGTMDAEQLRMEDRTVGKASVEVATRNGALEATFSSDFLSAGVHGEGRWQMAPGYPGKATVTFSEISLDRLKQWLGPQDAAQLQAEGVLSGKADLEGPLADFAAWRAAIEIPRLELRPQPNGGPVQGVESVLRNEGPVRLALDKSVLRVLNARLAGRTAKLDVKGSVSFNQRNAWDITVSGGLDLESLRGLNRDWILAGTVQVNVNVRGQLRRPQVQGRLELAGASFSVVDLPNGLSNVNGVVVFSGTRATVQSLTAEVGGGKVSASGYIQFEGAEPSVRMNLKATQVRVRYPEGVSTQANADLVLTGTAQQSLLSGDITVLRTGFTQRTDLSSILAKSSEPMLRPSGRTGPLSGMQFDVRVETASDASIESNLAQSIQAEASLRLRGTAYNPVLLGRVTITQGEITFFGTKYTISQGAINFLNPVKLEPILNLDVETKVRGIDVILTFAGPLNKLTVTHRADPPLEFSEVVALLATGRTPTSDPTLAARQSAADSSSFAQLGAAALVGQAISNPLSSRLQRFFGVSKLKIDPRLTGVENNPQARLTVEQQVTRTLTFTYITDLARSNSQIVRVEWWLNRQVSLVAIRDESGVFGLDMLYKKSFR